ncbi:NleE/OspZ family T3SS effector cysteine methyltransferase [Morganella psychrotolerans]|uniref:NleE/OspZ family T3SS effector cysteine methyltransferase n=2 Tax=Morganella psychrotolerans TaxID=368603 RepID=A0A5M9R185_9GAMM|nr:NleE/OspZ family T3SS effector cysteine methyltransferase [Morganella psychrotolerans]KAA8714308.1 NleE/OspZ family T3SS effector cysteine methyltransferase [Morganella psychrotolerans]
MNVNNHTELHLQDSLLPENNDMHPRIGMIYPQCNASDLNCDPEGYRQHPDIFTLKYDETRREILAFSGTCCETGTVHPCSVNNPSDSWLSVVKGLRPLGQFSVRSLYDPVLHGLYDTPELGIKCFLKQGDINIYIILVYRRDSDKGETGALDFIALMNEKKTMMESGEGTHEERVYYSEYTLGRRFGELLHYDPADIQHYETMMKNRLDYLKSPQ